MRQKTGRYTEIVIWTKEGLCQRLRHSQIDRKGRGGRGRSRDLPTGSGDKWQEFESNENNGRGSKNVSKNKQNGIVRKVGRAAGRAAGHGGEREESRQTGRQRTTEIDISSEG